jgi:hypothetical protein
VYSKSLLSCRVQAVSGFFKQTDKSNGRLSVEEMLDASFGLIDDSPGRWENLKKRVSGMESSASTIHKLMES